MSNRNKQKFSSIVKNNLYMLGKVAGYTPDYFFWMILEGIVWGAINSASAIFSFNLLNTVESGGDFGRAVMLIALMAVFYLVTYAFDRWYWEVHNPLMRRKLHLKMHEELFKKARTLDLACFDDPEFYNDFVWAMDESDKRAVEVMEDSGKLINRIVASFTLLSLLLTVDILVAVILFISSMITIICNLIGNKVEFVHNKESNPLNRKKSYINRVYHLTDYSKEIRISRADELLMRDYDDNTERLVELDRRYGKKYFIYFGLGWGIVGTLTFYVLLVYMMGLLSRGELLVGGFAAAVGVVWNIRWMLADLVERLTKYPKHSLYIEKYLEFMRYEPQIKNGITDIPEFESLELRNVSFAYEFSSHPKYKFHDEDHPVKEGLDKREALRDVSLTLRKGEKIAIVGYNGAGKTTLIKLLMRLYDPSEGEILYNGIDLRRLDPEAYRKKIGAVFQDFKIYAASIAENVMNGEYVEERDRETVIEALRKSDFSEKLASLKNGIDTHLTREFNDEGTNLSGGEAQKVAIARVFARDYPIIIMDEPSSALDPLAEYNLNKSILRHTESKTVIFISHRLSTTRIADRIYMFSEGRLIEEGGHGELMQQNGKYAEMFRLQSEKYRK